MLIPTYVYLPRDRFDTEQKARIAGAISQRHSEATGAPSYFVQVMIEETDAESARREVAAALSAIKCPRTIDFDAELPCHPSGKLYKRLVKDRYWIGHSKRIAE